METAAKVITGREEPRQQHNLEGFVKVNVKAASNS